MSKFLKIAIPAAAVGFGAYYYQTAVRATAVPPVFKGDNQWIDLTLSKVKPLSNDTAVYTFSFPEANQKSGLITASCILTKYQTAKGNNVIRPYTPINDPEDKGFVDLLVKTYEGGKMSVHIKELNVNDTLSFKGPIVKWEWKANQFKEIGLIGGGTGITPLYQVIHQVLNDANDKTKITLLYGSKTPEDILLKPELDALAAKHPDQFNIKYFVDKVEGDKPADLNEGYITKEVIEASIPKPSDDSHIFVCGPPPMQKLITGMKKSPSDQGELTGILAELGYDKSQVLKF